MAIRFSISSMLLLTACIAVLFSSYGFLPTLRGFKPEVMIERQIFNCCLAGSFFPSLVISLCRLHVASRYCWQSIFISTVYSSWIGYFLVHRWWAIMWESHSSEPQWPGMAGVLLFPFAVISSLIIASFTSALSTSIQRERLLLSRRTTRNSIA